MSDHEHSALGPTGETPAEAGPNAAEPDAIAPTSPPELLAVAPPRPRVFPPWSFWDVAAVPCFTVAAVFLCSTIALGVAHLLTSQRHVPISELASSPMVVIGAQAVAYPAVILFMAMLVRSRSQEGFWRIIRWNWPRASVFAFLIGGTLIAFGVGFVSRWLPIPKSLPVERIFSDAAGAYLMAVFGTTLAPLLEELFFRGMLYPWLRHRMGLGASVLLTAAAFAAIHSMQLGYAWAPLLSIFVVGVLLTLVRAATNSVGASFLVHCGYNFTLFATLWVGSDLFRHLEKMAS